MTDLPRETSDTFPPLVRCPLSPSSCRCRARSGRVPRESLDAPESPSKQTLRQVARQLDDEVPRMADEPPTGLEQPQQRTRQQPALDGDRQEEPAQRLLDHGYRLSVYGLDLAKVEAIAARGGVWFLRKSHW